MVRLRACYPGKIGDGDLWLANVARYFEELVAYPPHVVATAFERAWRAHPTFFPSLGELAVLCKIASKEKAADLPALPLPRHDHSAETMAAKARAAAYVRQALGGEAVSDD